MIPYAKIFDFGKKAVSTYKAGQQQLKPGPAPAGLKPVNAPAKAVVKKAAAKPPVKKPAPPKAPAAKPVAKSTTPLDTYNILGMEVKKSTANVLGCVAVFATAATIAYRWR